MCEDLSIHLFSDGLLSDNKGHSNSHLRKNIRPDAPAALMQASHTLHADPSSLIRTLMRIGGAL